MNTSEFRQHLRRIHAEYRAMVAEDRLDDLARELGGETWMPSTNGSAPSAVAIEVASEIMSELHAAAAKRDKHAARGALERLGRLVHLMQASPTARRP